MAKYSNGVYHPKNPQKYVGTGPIIFRSSWEMQMFRLLDQHPFVLNWASEPIKISYKTPLTERYANYIPDLLVSWLDKKGNTRVELIEIKPERETLAEKARTKKDKIAQAINQAKWAAAIAFCKRQGIVF